MKQSEALYINRNLSPLSVFMLFFQELSICWWWRQTDTITNTWTLLTKHLLCSLTWLSLNFFLFFFPWHTRQTDRLLGYNGTVLYTFLQQHYKTRQILTHSSLPTLCRQQ
jgi:hypothetical protein